MCDESSISLKKTTPSARRSVIYIRLCSFGYCLVDIDTFIQYTSYGIMLILMLMHRLALNLSEYFKRQFNAIDKKIDSVPK